MSKYEAWTMKDELVHEQMCTLNCELRDAKNYKWSELQEDRGLELTEIPELERTKK